MTRYVGPKTNSENLATQGDLTGGGGGVTVSATAPSSPTTGNLWYDSDTGEIFIYYDSQWSAPVVPTVPVRAADDDQAVLARQVFG